MIGVTVVAGTQLGGAPPLTVLTTTRICAVFGETYCGARFDDDGFAPIGNVTVKLTVCGVPDCCGLVGAGDVAGDEPPPPHPASKNSAAMASARDFMS